MESIKSLDKQYVANTYARADLQIVSGKGSLAYDETGKEYIDMGSGIAVNTFGYCDSEWVAAVTEQLSKVQHTSNLYYTEPQVLLAKEMCNRTGMKKVFFSNSGAESNECAIKTARKYSFDKYGKGRSVIVTLKGSFHGRTLTTLSATGQDVFHNYFFPFTEGFEFIEANNTEAALDILDRKDVCAIMMEAIQGEGGVIPLEKQYVKAVCEKASQNDILVIFDEVQTGNGRTGKLYGYMNFDVTPDIVSTAKGLAGGLPFGATLFGEKVENVLSAGTHGSTFGGNPVCAAGALNVFNRLDEKLFAEVLEKEKYIRNALEGAEGIEEVTGMGLMLGIKVKGDSKAVLKKCLENGLIVLTAKDKIRLLPSLKVTYEEIDKAIKILKKAVTEI